MCPKEWELNYIERSFTTIIRKSSSNCGNDLSRYCSNEHKVMGIKHMKRQHNLERNMNKTIVGFHLL